MGACGSLRRRGATSRCYNDDCVEVWVDPHNQRRRAYHLVFSVVVALGWGPVGGGVARSAGAHRLGRKLAAMRTRLEGTAEAAVARAEDGWTCEVRVPAVDSLPGIVEGSTWGLNVGRERWAFEEPGRAEHSSLIGTFAGR